MNTLLYLQANHRSSRVLEGSLQEPLFTRRYEMGLPWDERYRSYVSQSGLNHVNKIRQMLVDNALISALVERWRQETHTFHLPFGEATVTLEDVVVLFGLRIDGEALCPIIEHDWPALVTELLGNVDETTFQWIGDRPPEINVSWLLRTFSDCPRNADERTVQQYARAYLLILVGTVLFPHRSRRGSISSIYLPLFTDFEEAGGYSWGSAVLAFLYRELCSAAMNPDQRFIGGAAMLLQMWSWERFPIERPNYGPEIFNFPISEGENVYREAIDRLDESDVNWQPYEDKKNFLPPICRATPELWRTSAPLIHFWIVEMYNPHRVMRQFGRYQKIPPFNRNTSIELHEIQDTVWNNWPAVHAAHLQHWHRRWSCCSLDERPYDLSTRDMYMRWFSYYPIQYLTGPPPP